MVKLLKMLKLKVVEKKEEITNDWPIIRVAKEYTPYTWEKVFENAASELEEISEMLEEDKPKGRRLPDNKDIFKVFNLVPLHKVKVIIVGQDPYHTVLSDGTPQAMGMCFATRKGCPVQPSLKNIYKEIKSNYPDTFNIPNHGDLTSWCHQGVFLLNACLTVRQGEPDSHKQVWLGFIKKVINAILDANPGVIFLLWGGNAQKLSKIIGSRATILTAAHPSGLSASRGFFGNGHFKQVNEILTKLGKSPIDWNVY